MWSTPDTITISIAIQFLDRRYGSICNRLRTAIQFLDRRYRSICNRLRVAVQSQSSIKKSSIRNLSIKTPSSIKKSSIKKSSIKKSSIGQSSIRKSSIKNSGSRKLRVVHTRNVCDLSFSYRYSLVQLSCLSLRPIRERHFLD